MISEIRTLFTNRIKEIDTDFKFDGEIFDIEAVSSTQLNRSYALIVGDSVYERLDTSQRRSFSVTVNVWSRSGTDSVADHDKAYDKAIDISSNVVDQRNIPQVDSFIKTITENSITRIPIEGDDNSVKFEIQFNVTTYYAIK